MLNVLVVVAVIALIGLGTYILIRESLVQQSTDALTERVQLARVTWSSDVASGNPLAMQSATPVDPDQGELDDDEDGGGGESQEILESGDTLVFIMDANGTLLINQRNVDLPGIPVSAAVDRAISGNVDNRSVDIGGQSISVRTEPVRLEGSIIGVVQAIRSNQEQHKELVLLRTASIVGSCFGIVAAAIAGLFLAQRSMQPIAAAFERQRTFVADASHELRTPLTVIRAHVELLQRLPDPSSELLRQEIDELLVEIDSMNRLTSQLLDLARVEFDDLEPSMTSLDLKALLESSVGEMSPITRASGRAIQSQVDSIAITTDATLLKQIVRILLDNAVKYSEAHSIIILQTQVSADSVSIEVTDTGEGISEADVPFVFDRFFRSERSRARQSGGSGLGLSIARELTRRLGGTISLKSTSGQGTVATITLPLPNRQ